MLGIRIIPARRKVAKIKIDEVVTLPLFLTALLPVVIVMRAITPARMVRNATGIAGALVEVFANRHFHLVKNLRSTDSKTF